MPDRRLRNVQGKHAQPLNGIEEKQGSATMRNLGHPLQVVPPASGIGNPTDGNDAGAAVAGVGQAI